MKDILKGLSLRITTLWIHLLRTYTSPLKYTKVKSQITFPVP